MPVYEYRCEACGKICQRVDSVANMKATVRCEHCGSAVAHRIISRTAVKLSSASKLDRLDPRYDRMVDQAMRNTQGAEPDHLLKKMRPFSDAKD